jgi:hypothetical protein
VANYPDSCGSYSDFISSDQTELLESNLLTATLLSVYEVYSPANHTLTWTLTETDFTALAKQGIKVAFTPLCTWHQHI